MYVPIQQKLKPFQKKKKNKNKTICQPDELNI